ncbi:FAD-dependent monooxygenase [Ramlibacter sp. 2FC]|uniref:FAD-dependent monooxygenase n=1 Tax=Ramlibacter sp. 2FC TaxID=2502188 RepID=UPI0010F8AB4C|nr:FAD-dependent monooxygenase [Ramlibacter sp. 2FC]
MTKQLLVAGGGIGGLAAALAGARVGWEVRLFERAPVFSEVGAGIQIGPNVVKILHAWGLEAALARVAAFPQRLSVRNAMTARELGVLPLGERALLKYGAPYATVHRADLHGLLLEALQAQAGVWLNPGSGLASFRESEHAVSLRTAAGLEVEGDALVGADGLWSRVRELLLADGPPRVTGHLAYRALLPQAELPERLRSQQVTVWLGPQLHVVHYPVRGGEGLNVVAIVHGRAVTDLQGWDHSTNAAELRAALAGTCLPLQDMIHAVPEWRLWALCDRAPMTGADQQARGRVALLGDAAHPMRPYLAQGACMAIEDADELGRALGLDELEVPLRLRRYALNRWQRCARVQAHSIRNGLIFHSTGLVRWGRDASLRLLGERLLDLPWLYRGA